jgi:hypothetical protein
LPEIERNVRASAQIMTRHAMTRTILLLSLLAGSLAACASAKDTEARNEARCQARGLEPNTKNYEECMRQVDAERSARMEQRRREALEQPAIPPSNRGY